jgi:hypothetical protein
MLLFVALTHLDEKSSFLDILQRYQSFFKSCKQILLIVKQNDKWYLLCGKIELSNYDQPSSEKEVYALNNRYPCSVFVSTSALVFLLPLLSFISMVIMHISSPPPPNKQDFMSHACAKIIIIF